MFEGAGAGVLFEAGEHFEGDFLGEIFLGLTSWEVAADDGDDERVEHFGEVPGSGLAPSMERGQHFCGDF